jgi:hypothetical protein
MACYLLLRYTIYVQNKEKNKPVFFKVYADQLFFWTGFSAVFAGNSLPCPAKKSGGTTVNSFFFCRSDIEKQHLNQGCAGIKSS